MVIELNDICGNRIYLFVQHIVAIQSDMEHAGRTKVFMDDGTTSVFVVKEDVEMILAKIKEAKMLT